MILNEQYNSPLGVFMRCSIFICLFLFCLNFTFFVLIFSLIPSLLFPLRVDKAWFPALFFDFTLTLWQYGHPISPFSLNTFDFTLLLHALTSQKSFCLFSFYHSIIFPYLLSSLSLLVYLLVYPLHINTISLNARTINFNDLKDRGKVGSIALFRFSVISL